MIREAAIILCLCLAATGSQVTQDAESYIDGLNTAINVLSDNNDNQEDTYGFMCRGDVSSTQEQPLAVGDQALTGRKAVPIEERLWPDAVIPFEFHKSIELYNFSREHKTLIKDAMTHWSNNTCISFRNRQPSDESFIIIRSDMNGCASQAGRDVGGQDLRLGKNCYHRGTIVHELGHVIGFYHEQSRLDRDEHVMILWCNIARDNWSEFRKMNDSNYSVPYDLTSIMHYEDNSGTYDVGSSRSIVTKDLFQQRLLSRRHSLSFRDRLLANLMYNCTDKTSTACKNGGYMRRTTLGHSAGTYSCDCPPNTKGEFCEDKLREDYYEELPCGGNVTREGFIETPGYPNRTQINMNCAWNITAPAGHRVELTIEGFKFSARINNSVITSSNNKCGYESVEFRLNKSNPYVGVFYCGTDLEPGQVLKSYGRSAVIIVRVEDVLNGSGLRAKVSFVPLISNQN